MKFEASLVAIFVCLGGNVASGFVASPAKTFGIQHCRPFKLSDVSSIETSTAVGTAMVATEEPSVEEGTELPAAEEEGEEEVAVEETAEVEATEEEGGDEEAASEEEEPAEEEKFSVFVKNLPFELNEDEVIAVFAEHGEVKAASFPQRLGLYRGFGFVDYATKEQMETAIEKLNQSEIAGRTIMCRENTGPKRSRQVEGFRLYVGNLKYGVDPTQLKEFFEQYGPVLQVYIARDDDGLDRGFAFVTVDTEETALKVIQATNGSFFQGREIAVRQPDTDATRIYFGNLSYETTLETVKELFEQHGEVRNIYLMKYEDGASRGFGFAQVKKDDAENFISALDRTEVEGRTMSVSIASDRKTKKTKLYCGNLSFDITTEKVKEMFSDFGTVISCYLPTDSRYGGSRGFAMVTMEQEAANLAMEALNGKEVDGRELIVNEAQPFTQKTKTTTLYVGNLGFDSSPDALKDIFSEYGEVLDCRAPEDRDFGGHRGFAFIKMNNEDAAKAMDELNGYELDGRALRVSISTPK